MYTGVLKAAAYLHGDDDDDDDGGDDGALSLRR